MTLSFRVHVKLSYRIVSYHISQSVAAIETWRNCVWRRHCCHGYMMIPAVATHVVYVTAVFISMLYFHISATLPCRQNTVTW